MTLHAEVLVERGPSFALHAAVDAADGEVLVILGPNGAGKTTLLRALAGLLPLTGGRVELAGAVLDDPAAGVRVGPQDRRVGVVFQDYRLFPHLSARENVAFGLRSTGTPRVAARAAADALLARFGLADLAERRPRELSGGQAQRVAVARALARDPAMMLLDEPLAALDASTRAAVRADLRERLTEFTGPSLVVTHDPLEALTLGDRLLVLEGGAVVQTGRSAEVARRPATAYVAELVGLNLYRGTAAGGVLRLDGGGMLHIRDPALTGPALATVPPSAVTLHLAEPGPSSARNRWPVRVEAVESLGDRVRASLSGPPAVRADITTRSAAELRLRPGHRLWATVKTVNVEAYAAP